MRTNFSIVQPVASSVQRLTAKAANTRGQVGFDGVSLMVEDPGGCRSCLAIWKDFLAKALAFSSPVYCSPISRGSR
jgi:hypothetical protein